MSGRKSVLQRFKNIVAQSMGGNITSAVTNIEMLDNIGVQVIWSAGSTPVGVISVEVSMDYDQDTLGNVVNAGNWIALTLDPAANVSGNTGQIYVDLNQLSAPWIRVKYTRTSGTATLSGYICGKML